MTVVLRDIDVAKRTSSGIFDNVDAQMLPLSEYLKIAERCIGRWANPTLARYMLSDEDAISHVAEHLMYGHCRWTENGGRALHSYLNQCAIWSIKIWKNKLYEVYQKTPHISLNMELESGRSELSSIIPDKRPTESSFNETVEELELFINSECLTGHQQECLRKRYLDGMTMQAIADEQDTSKNAVSLTLNRAITNLQREYGTTYNE